MQKVYLLLRSNKQTGPYTLDDLLKLNLKPLDLVWVEGKSFGWSYPSEIESLKSFVAQPTEDKTETPGPPQHNSPIQNASPANATKKIFVSMPVNGSNVFRSNSEPLKKSPLQKAEELSQNKNDQSEPKEPEPDHNALERKAEELRQRAQAYAAVKPIQKPNEVVEIKYAKSLEEVEEDYTTWLYQKKTKNKTTISKDQLISALAVIVVIAGGWWIGSAIFSGESKNADQVVHVQNSIKEEIHPVITDQVDESISYDIADLKTDDLKAGEKYQLKQKNHTIENPVKDVYETHIASAPIEIYKSLEPYEKQIPEPEQEPAAEVEYKKKKTLGEAVNEVFRKLTKTDDAEEKKETTSTNGERKPSHRGEMGSSEIDISDQVEIRMNNTTENWMMGVIGLKLTLHNRSSILVKSAEVEVLFFNEQNKLLEKKRLTFSNVAPKKSQTLPAPDHRLADHAEIKLISATGIQDAYAKH